MKNVSKGSWPVLLKMFLLLPFLAPVTVGFSLPTVVESSCPAPSVTETSQTSTSISFSWNAVDGASEYRTWYVREEDDYTSSEVATSNTSFTHAGLTPGTYHFHFVTVCGSETSSITIVVDLIM